MRRRALVWAAGLALAAAFDASAVVNPATLTDATVQAAVRAIVHELYRRHDAEHFWDPPSWNPDRDGQVSQIGGYTPLVVLAMLHAGESYQDPRLRAAVDHIARANLTGTYAVALRTHVWALLPARFSDRLADDTRWLTDSFKPERAGWSYEQPSRSGRYDNSLAQYGALALWEAGKRGVPVADRYWQRLEQRFIDNQFADGGWNYRTNQPVSGSMTAAGLTTLFITQDVLHARDAISLDDRPKRPYERAIESGLRWMNENFTAAGNPGKNTYFFYYLYGVERVGLASGYASFGGHDWFRAGAAAIIDRLCRVDAASGAVTVRSGSSRRNAAEVRRLAFALLFLSRGRVPLAINKLMVPGLAWNNRPRDVANLTHWLGRETEAELNWQIVSLDDPPESWLDAPVLYLASDERLPWVAEPSDELAKIKRYLDLGGLLLAAAEGRGTAFARSVQDAGRAMYPQHEWRVLPRDHWAYTLLFSAKGKRPRLRGLSNGVRELIVLVQGTDLPAVLQSRDEKRLPFWTTAAHVYLHASEMNRPRPRLARHAPATAGGESSNGDRVTVVRATYDGNWDPEPLALEVFDGAVQDIALAVTVHALAGIADLDPRPDLVTVNGVAAREFAAAEQDAIKAFIDAGGVILFETPGGRGGFTRSAEDMAQALFGIKAQRLVDTRVVTGDGLSGASNLAQVRYRPYAQQVFAAHETTPRLRGLVIDGQPRVLFSREDISQALLDQPCWGVAGYSPATARQLMANILCHAAAMRQR